MSKLILSFIASLFLSVGVAAQTRLKPVEMVKINTPQAMCEACKKRIETYLNRYDGVSLINVNYRTGITQVKYITDRINIEEIKTAIANAGYDAGDVTANPDAYKRLPLSCKKFEDGGGHPKPRPKPVSPAPITQ